VKWEFLLFCVCRFGSADHRHNVKQRTATPAFIRHRILGFESPSTTPSLSAADDSKQPRAPTTGSAEGSALPPNAPQTSSTFLPSMIAPTVHSASADPFVASSGAGTAAGGGGGEQQQMNAFLESADTVCALMFFAFKVTCDVVV
jgi:hypothetical protein